MILAVDNENGIGKAGDLAWRIPEDMKFFTTTTKNTTGSNKKNAVIMGRKTWDSLPEKYRPLPGRINCVLSRKYTNIWTNISPNAFGFPDLQSCHQFLSKSNDVEEVFIIGGAQVYNAALQENCLETVYITRIYDKFHCDVFFEGLSSKKFKRISRSEMKEYKGVEYEFLVYKRKRNIFQKIKRLFS